MPGVLASAGKLQHYIAIKKLEGEIVSYAHKIQLENTNMEFDKEKAEELGHKVDKLVNAVSSGVYSAKSLKDINENLETFYVIDNDVLGKYFNE